MKETWIQIVSYFLANMSLLILFRSNIENDKKILNTKIDSILFEIRNINDRIEKIENLDNKFKSNLIESVKNKQVQT